MKFTEYYEEAKKRLVTKCTGCGNCVKNCRVMSFAGYPFDAAVMRKGIIDFLCGGEKPSEAALFRMNSCMRCYACLDIKCPAGVTPMLTGELVAREIELRKEEPWENIVLYPVHDELARKGTSPEEYRRITGEALVPGAEYLFFPGCNVYKQPDKLLNALTIMDTVGRPYSFAPGLKYCCGSSPRGIRGDAAWQEDAVDRLFGLAEKNRVREMIFWCPTCLSFLEAHIRHYYTPPFRCVSFSQYLAENLDRLRFPAALPHKVTYHEPCKNAYMGIDTNCTRQVLRAIPGTELVEMEHHGKDTLCCGCRAVASMPSLGAVVAVERLKEAQATGADTLIDLCHNCHWIFVPARKAHPELNFSLNIENFSTYVAGAMGKARKDLLGASEN
jgi:Fe-S oxidoreductase